MFNIIASVLTNTYNLKYFAIGLIVFGIVCFVLGGFVNMLNDLWWSKRKRRFSMKRLRPICAETLLEVRLEKAIVWRNIFATIAGGLAGVLVSLVYLYLRSI